MEKQEFYVLMVAFHAQGHINPLLRLGKSLLSKGLTVTLATTELVYHRMFKHNQPHPDHATSTPPSISGVQLLFYSDGLGMDDDRTGLDQYMDTLSKFGSINLSKLIKLHFPGGHKKLSCIISNPFVPWVTDVAAHHDIPCACLWIQPCALYAIYYRFNNNLNQFPTLSNQDMRVDLPGLPLLQTDDLPSFVLPSNKHRILTKLLSDMFQNMRKLKWVLANSFDELEKQVISSMSDLSPLLTVGPLVPLSLLGKEEEEEDGGIDTWKPQDSCIEWLDRQPPNSVIYISFGSVLVLYTKQTESIAMAIKNSKRPFLWVIKQQGELKDQEVGELPCGFLEETKERGVIVHWSPQTKVLSHPAVACFLTHCGWNSTLEAITAGTPMIACPQWTHQPTNAKLLVDVFKMGLRLKPDSNGFVGTEEVARAIEGVFSGPCSEDIKRNAADLKAAARAAVVRGGSSERNIQLFVDGIIAHDKKTQDLKGAEKEDCVPKSDTSSC